MPLIPCASNELPARTPRPFFFLRIVPRFSPVLRSYFAREVAGRNQFDPGHNRSSTVRNSYVAPTNAVAEQPVRSLDQLNL
jgi:hypothetical protein